MRKFTCRLLLVLLLNTFCVFSFAQEIFKSSFSFGAKLGPTYSRAIFIPEFDQSFHPGYTGGLVFKFISEPGLGLQLEANYTQKGWAEHFNDKLVYSRDVRYAQLAFLTHYMPGIQKYRFVFNIGPYLSLLTDESEHFDLNSPGINRKHYHVAVDNQYELGACIGLGVNRQIRKGALQLESRCEYSFSNLFETLYTYSQNITLGVTITYFYTF